MVLLINIRWHLYVVIGDDQHEKAIKGHANKFLVHSDIALIKIIGELSLSWP